MELEELVGALSSLEDSDLVNVIVSALDDRPNACQAVTDWMVDSDEQKVYLSTKMFTSRRMSGVVKSFNAKNGYGFISSEGCKEAFGCDVFVHHAQIEKAVVNDHVNFVIFLNKDQKPHAYDVRVEESPMSAAPAYKASGKGKLGYAATPAHDPGFGMPRPNSVNSLQGKGAAPITLLNVPTWGQGANACGGGKGVAVKKAGVSKLHRQPVKPTPGSSVEMPGVTDQRWDGVLKSFNEKTGFGFIECEELKQIFGGDVFVHRLQVAEFSPDPGIAVEFGVFLNKDEKPQAKEIIPQATALPPAKRPRQW